MTLSLNDARLLWAGAQGLGARADEAPAVTCARTGWLRTLGGAEAYLALAARNSTVAVASVHEAIASGSLRVSPSVRGCIYVVPAEHAPLSLRIARRLTEKRALRDQEKAGVVEGELDTLGELIVSALQDGPCSTQGLRSLLPDDAIRSLGDAGKKIGITSTLPPALRQLEFGGRIARRPVDDRADHERYEWRIAERDDLSQPGDETADAAALAALYARWAGPVTRDEFAAWSGLGKRDAGAALDAAELRAIDIEGLGEAWLHPEVEPAAPGIERWLPGMDNLYGLHMSGAAMVDAADADVPVATFNSRGTGRLGEISQPVDRTIVRDGRVVGLWASSPDAAAPVVHRFDGRSGEGSEAAWVSALLAELGHGRVTVMDRDDKLQARADRISALG